MVPCSSNDSWPVHAFLWSFVILAYSQSASLADFINVSLEYRLKMVLRGTRRHSQVAYVLLILLTIGYTVSAANARKRRKDSYQKKHELHGSRKQTYGKLHKKAEIDFSSSEFSDSDASDDVPDDANSEKAIDKEQSDYDDSEAENREFNDSEDNEITDLSEGEAVQSESEEMSFDTDGSKSYDGYDEDEDSAAEEDDDDSDSNFTETDDEEMMSDISHINDYSEEIDPEDEESDESEKLDNSEESFVDEALEEADANVDETDYEAAGASSSDVETTAQEADSSDMTDDSAAKVDQSELEAEYEAATNSSGGAFSEKGKDKTPDLGGVDAKGNSSPSEQASDSNSAPKEPAPAELQGEKRADIEADGIDDLAATPQTILADEIARQNLTGNSVDTVDSLKNYTESMEPASAVEDESSPPAESFSNDDNNSAIEDANAQPDNASNNKTNTSMSSTKTALSTENPDLNDNTTAGESSIEGLEDFNNGDEGGDLDEEDDISADDTTANTGSDNAGSATNLDDNSDEDAGVADDDTGLDDAVDADDNFEDADELDAEDDNDEETGEKMVEKDATRDKLGNDDLDKNKNAGVASEANAEKTAGVATELKEDGEVDASEKDDVEEVPNPEEYFDTEDDDDDDDIPLNECEPAEAEVRTFRGMLTGETRGFMSGLKKMANKVLGRPRPKPKMPRISRRPQISKNKMLLTGVKPPTLGMMSEWNSRLMTWNWKSYARFGSASNPAHAAFLVDASIRKHMGIMQRLSYNLAKVMPLKSSYFTIASFGKGFNQVVAFRRYANNQQLQAAMSQIKEDNTKSRRTGEAMQQMVRIFTAAKAKSPAMKQVLFVFVRGRSYGCIYKLQAAAKALRLLGVRVYVIGFGTRLILEELTMMTKPIMIFRATTYAHLVKGNIGAPGILPRLANRLIRWLDGGGGACGKANVGFLLDTSSPSSRKFIQKLVYNYIRLFQLQGTTVTIYSYGPSQKRVCDWRAFGSPTEIQGVINSIPIMPGGYRKTGQAMAEMYKRFETQRRRNGLPNILFVITSGATTDGDIMKPIGDRFRAKGIKVWAYGVNPQAKKFVDELKNIAANPSYVIYGPKKSHVTPERFTAIQELIKQVSGKGSAITIHIGNKKTLKIQKTWEWPKGYKGIQYGVVNAANVAFLVEGFFPDNLGYVRKFIYNIIRTFKLSGTYVTLMDYGDAQYRVANWVQLKNGADVRNLVRKLPKSSRPARRTGLALQAALNAFSTAPAGNLNILILITKGKSSDDVVIPAANLRKKGIKTLAVGLTGFNPQRNLGDKGFKQREISLIPFSSAQIFAARIDGLLPLSGVIMRSLQKLVGKPSPSSGSSGKIDVSPTDFVYQWYWKTPTNNLISYGLNPVNLVVIMDGASRKHLDILQRLVFNIVRLFGPKSNVAFVIFGGSVDLRFAVWKNYIGLGPLQSAVSSLSYRGVPGSRVGPAIATAGKLFATAPSKARKNIAIVILTRLPQDYLSGPVKELKNLKKTGVILFNVGIVPLTPAKLKPLPDTTIVVDWKQLPEVVVKIRVLIIKDVGPIPGERDTGTQPKPPPTPPIDPPLPSPIDPGIGSKGSKDIEKLRSTWDWDKIINGITYESLKPAELIFVVDVTEDNNFDITIKFMYNIIRLFKLGTVRVSLVSFGRKPRLRFFSTPIPKIKQIQTMLTKITPRNDKETNVGAAFEFVRMRVTSRIKPSVPRVVVLIMQGGSDDNVLSPSRKLKGSGVLIVSVGIGDAPKEELPITASRGDLALQSPFSKLPAIVVRIQYGLTMPINGPPTDRAIDPDNSGIGGKDVKDQESTTSIPDETCGKPDSGKPGGPSTRDPEEGGRGGATGDKPDNAGGTDTGAGGGATGTNVTPVGPKKPVPKPKPPRKPDGNAGGPGTPGGEEEEKPNVEGPTGKKPGEPAPPGTPGTPGAPGTPGTPGVPSDGKPSTPGGGTAPEIEEPTDGKRPGKIKPGTKEPGIGDKEKEKGGDKISDNTGVNPSGGVTNPNTENGGENTGPIKPIDTGGDDDKEDPVTGGIQIMDFPTDLFPRLTTQWNWEKAINNFGYDTIAPSRVGFIIDGSTPKNFELIKHYIFNIARMFKIRSSTFTIVQFGKTPTRVIIQDKRVICPAELRIEFDKIIPDTGGANIGPALATVQKLFGVKRRGPAVLFIIVQSRLVGNINGVYGTVRNMKAAGTKIYSIGIGGSYDVTQVSGLGGNDKNSYATLLPSLVGGSMMNLQFWCLRNIGPGNKLGRYFLKQGLVAQIGKPRPKPTPGKGLILKLQIIATSCDDAPARGRCRDAPASIKVNGLERSFNKRGLNFAVFDLSTGRFEGSVSFDTNGNPMAVKQMIAYIDKIKPNRLVLVASRDSYNARMNSKAYSALYSIGGEEPFSKGLRSSYALLGFKGKQKASWTKQVALKGGKGPATISAQIMVKRVRDEPLKPASEFGQTVCQDKDLVIACPAGLKIGITYAMFGRQNKDVCKHSAMLNVNCKSPLSLDRMKKRCEGRKTCQVRASTQNFRDPCSGTYKYLEVKWTCKGTKTPAPAARPALKIDITSMGCNDPPARGRCDASVGSIKLNGKEASLNKRGINIVCISYPRGKVIRRKTYDTHANRLISNSLLKLIQRIPDNTIVLVATRAEYATGFTAQTQMALKMIGGKGRLNMGKRGSLALIGFKGKGSFSWKKQIGRSAGKGPSVISESISLPFKVIMPRSGKPPLLPPKPMAPKFASVDTVGGNARGAKCVFPFKYKGKIYSKCTKLNHNRPWCSTTADYDKDKKWGNCKNSAKREELEEPIFEDDDEDDSDEYDDTEYRSSTCDVVD